MTSLHGISGVIACKRSENSRRFHLQSSEKYIINLSLHGVKGNMVGHCTRVLYFTRLRLVKYVAHSCNIPPYCPSPHAIIYIYSGIPSHIVTHRVRARKYYPVLRNTGVVPGIRIAHSAPDPVLRNNLAATWHIE